MASLMLPAGGAGGVAGEEGGAEPAGMLACPPTLGLFLAGGPASSFPSAFTGDSRLRLPIRPFLMYPRPRPTSRRRSTKQILKKKKRAKWVPQQYSGTMVGAVYTNRTLLKE